MKWRETRACGMSFLEVRCNTSFLAMSDYGMSWLGAWGRGMSCLVDVDVMLGGA